MHRLTLAALLILAACARPAPLPESYRDAGLQLYSNAAFDPARLEGRWQQVAAFASPNSPDCGPGEVRFGPSAGGALNLEARLCLAGRTETFAGRADLIGPGRIALSGADPNGIGAPWWVIWVDVDYRTLVIGTPSGRLGFILNRGGPLPQDRLAAAREILDWNGYDLSQLRLVR